MHLNSLAKKEGCKQILQILELTCAKPKGTNEIDLRYNVSQWKFRQTLKEQKLNFRILNYQIVKFTFIKISSHLDFF